MEWCQLIGAPLNRYEASIDDLPYNVIWRNPMSLTGLVIRNALFINVLDLPNLARIV
jgi:hypothetical protein